MGLTGRDSENRRWQRVVLQKNRLQNTAFKSGYVAEEVLTAKDKQKAIF